MVPVQRVDALAPSVNLLGHNRDQLDMFFKPLGEQRFRSTQVLKWLHQLGCNDFSLMTNLSKSLRAKLGELATIEAPLLVNEQHSSDGTHKWLLQLAGGNCIETVYIPEPNRSTLCISSQVGCALNCRFCSTAQQGFNRNLSSAEIIGQLWLANQHLKAGGKPPISNVVLMGMGEPLLNFDAVVRALDIMLDDFAYGLSRRRVTLSTAGHVPGIRRLKQRRAVALAVSLHATNDALRDELVPLNRSFPIAELLHACREYVASDPRSRITFEYVMLDGVNDSPHDARALVRLLANVPAKVNLIPFNPFPGTQFRRSPPQRIAAFQNVLIERGMTTITRKTRGDDIDAACGQLAGRVAPKSARVRRHRVLAHAASQT